MPIYPRAVYRRPPGMTVGPRRARTDAVIWHVDAGDVRDLYGWWNDPGSGANGSHFHVATDGTVFQYADTDLTTYTSGAGSRRSIGIETQGKAAGEWTPAQAAALVDLTRWLCEVHNIPARAMSSSKTTERGIGWHTLGVPGTQAQKRAGVSQTGGESWSSSVGKVCPGPDRIRQIPGLIARINGTPAGPNPPQSEEDDMFSDTDRELLEDLHVALGAGGARNLPAKDQTNRSVLAHVRAIKTDTWDVRLALTNALPILIAGAKASNDPVQRDAAEVAQRVLDGIAKRLQD